jgi:hypothetical protein
MRDRPSAFRLVRGLSCIAASIVLAGASSVAAAETSARLSNLQGTVLVDVGAGFVKVSEDTALKLGDRVMVTDGGGAVLDYGNDCSLPLEAPSMTTVSETMCTVSTQNGGSRTGMILGIGLTGAAFTFIGLCAADVICDDNDRPTSP